MTVEIRGLRRSDDRSLFRSGDQALDLYFHRYAGPEPVSVITLVRDLRSRSMASALWGL